MLYYSVSVIKKNGEVNRYNFEKKAEVVECLKVNGSNVIDVFYDGICLTVGAFLILFSDYIHFSN